MYDSGDHTVEQIAAAFNVGRTTMYRRQTPYRVSTRSAGCGGELARTTLVPTLPLGTASGVPGRLELFLGQRLQEWSPLVGEVLPDCVGAVRQRSTSARSPSNCAASW